MNLITESYKRLYPDKDLNYTPIIEYSVHKKFNASIRINRIAGTITITMSKKWQDIDDEIKIGMIQELLLKILGNKGKDRIKTTINIDLYNNFMRSLHLTIPKSRIDPVLEESFHRVNEKYFYGLLDMPNLIWGRENFRTWATYEYQNDTVTVSNIFRDESPQAIDYLMYHELLHKKYKYNAIAGRKYAHTHLFKKKEKEFENAEDIENLLRMIAKRKRVFSSPGKKPAKSRGLLGWLRV